MATLVSKATGNFTAAGTWAPCSVAGELDSEAGTDNVTTANIDSSTFVLEANQIDAIAAKLATFSGPTGTFSITLRNSTTATNIATVTVNCSDFDTNANGWYVFPLGLNHTPNGTDSYLIRMARSTSVGTLGFYRDGTANNHTRQVRRTATQAPAAGDKLIIAGEHAGAGTGNSFTVTMDNTATTSYGPTVSGGPPDGISVNKRATLQYSTSVNAYLRMKGRFAVYGGGTLNIGTSGTRMGAANIGVLEFDCVVNVDSGLNTFPGSVFNGYGDNARLVTTLMTADKVAGNTVITVASTAGWVNGDVFAFAATSRTASECESKPSATIDSPTQFTLASGLTNAHSGTSPTQAEVVNLTRNVKIRGVSATLQGYCLFQTTSTVNCDYVEFTQLGSATANKRGITIATTTGSVSLTHCSFHDSTVTSSIGLETSGAAWSNLTYSNNVTFNIANVHFTVAATTGTWTADSNVFLRNTDAGVNLVNLSDVGGTFTNNTMAGAIGVGVNFAESNATIGTCAGNVAHSNNSTGYQLNVLGLGGTIDTPTIWRNNGIGFGTGNNTGPHSLVVSNAVMFGNSSHNIQCSGSWGNVLFTNGVFSGDSTFSTASGFNPNSTSACEVIFEGCTFGVASGIKTAHTTGDVNVTGTPYVECVLRNSLLASTVEIATQNNLEPAAYIRSQKHDQTAGNHKTWTRYGTISVDTTLFDTSPSIRLTPNNASFKLATDGGSVDGKGSLRVPVANGGSVTVSVKVRQSVAGDGTAYNGALPRLVLRKNVAAGIAADTVLATATVASSGAFETISGTTPAVTDDCVLSLVVDCDGTTGWVNVDTWTASGAQPSLSNQFWLDGEPFAVAGGSGGGFVLVEDD